MPKLADWVKQGVTGTPGVGAITLGAAVAGYIRLQDDSRIVDGDYVHYTIEDGVDGLERERGIGRYMAAGTQLERTLIQARIQSGVYAENVGLTLTSAAVVSVSAMSDPIRFKGALLQSAGNQSIANNSWVDVNLATTVYDTHNLISLTTPATFTPPAWVKKIRLHAEVYWQGNATGYRFLRITNAAGTMLFETICPDVAPVALSFSQRIITPVIPVLETDYKMVVNQNSGGALNAVLGKTQFAIEIIE